MLSDQYAIKSVLLPRTDISYLLKLLMISIFDVIFFFFNNMSFLKGIRKKRLRDITESEPPPLPRKKSAYSSIPCKYISTLMMIKMI